VLGVAKRVKQAFPSVYILLGGFTASLYHEEILRNFDEVDGVIRGEAETPLLELAHILLQGKEDLFSVPNLTWRRKGRIMINPLSYVASEKDLNRLSFTNFPLLKNFRTYIQFIGQPFYVKGVSPRRRISGCILLNRPSTISPLAGGVQFNAPGVAATFLLRR